MNFQKRLLEENWKKYLGGAAAGAVGAGLADHFNVGGLGDMNDDMQQAATDGNYWNTGIDKVNGLLDHVKTGAGNISSVPVAAAAPVVEAPSNMANGFDNIGQPLTPFNPSITREGIAPQPEAAPSFSSRMNSNQTPTGVEPYTYNGPVGNPAPVGEFDEVKKAVGMTTNVDPNITQTPMGTGEYKYNGPIGSPTPEVVPSVDPNVTQTPAGVDPYKYNGPINAPAPVVPPTPTPANYLNGNTTIGSAAGTAVGPTGTDGSTANTANIHHKIAGLDNKIQDIKLGQPSGNEAAIKASAPSYTDTADKRITPEQDDTKPNETSTPAKNAPFKQRYASKDMSLDKTLSMF